MCQLLFALLLLPACLMAQVEKIEPTSVEASSFMAGKTSYPPGNVNDADLKTWWTPAPPSSNGSGAWLQLNFSNTMRVSQIVIHPGSHYPNYPNIGNIFPMNLRLRQAKLEFADGTTEEITLEDKDEKQVISLKSSHVTDYVKLIPKAVYSASKWQDLCISHFEASGEEFVESAEGTESQEQTDGETGANDFSSFVGVYMETEDLCTPSVSYILPNADGSYTATTMYTMDAVGGKIKKIGYDDAGNKVIQVYSGEGEDNTTELIIEKSIFNLCGAFSLECENPGGYESPYDFVSNLYRLNVMSTYLAGVWESDRGGRYEFFTDDFSETTEQQQERFLYKILPPWEGLAGACFYIEYTNAQGTIIRLGMTGNENQLWGKSVISEEEGPGESLSQDNFWTLTRVD